MEVKDIDTMKYFILFNVICIFLQFSLDLHYKHSMRCYVSFAQAFLSVTFKMKMFSRPWNVAATQFLKF